MGVPKLIMLVGLPGSGKTTFAKNNCCDFIVHSSDDLRVELYDNVNDQTHNAELFIELHKRVKEDLKRGNNVVYDATNLNKKRRIAFLQELKNIPCYKECVVCLVPSEDCLRRNLLRDRAVPLSVLHRMYLNFQPPHKHEGFDNIKLYYGFDGDEYEECVNYYNSTRFFKDSINFDQENHHHSLTLGEHCIEAAKYIKDKYPLREDLFLAAFYHDQGKLSTKIFYKPDGKLDEEAHYYQHHCVGAYDSFFYLFNYGCSVDEILYISNLIYFHMHPYMSWYQSDKAMVKDRWLIGDKMFKDVLALHEADLAAH